MALVFGICTERQFCVAAPEHMLCLQNGRYDHADRMFNRCVMTFFFFFPLKNCSAFINVYNHDLRETKPSFYSMFKNALGTNLVTETQNIFIYLLPFIHFQQPK